MIENRLCTALAEFLKNEADVLTEVPGSVDGKRSVVMKPEVHVGYLPLKQSAQCAYPPFVVIRADSASSSRQKTEVKVSIICGVFCPEKNPTFGYEDCINLMSRIRSALMSLPTRILDGRYTLEDPITWKTYDEQPWPRFQIDMETTWLMKPIEPIDINGGYL